MPFYINTHMVYGVKLIETIVSECQHFEKARLLVAFYHEFKLFVQFSVNWDRH